MALRKTARALETENELLQEEKMKIIKDQDRIRNNLEATIKDRQTQVKVLKQWLQDIHYTLVF